MASITHFSHEHPLILLQQLPPEGVPLVCYGCQQPLTREGTHDSDNVYGCEICKTFFLHKSCAQLPMEIVHKSHKHHPLFLLSMLPTHYLGLWCDLCEKRTNGFFYHCHLDNFDLDIECALENKESLLHIRKDLLLNHPSHKLHPLTLQPRPTSFLCDACDVEDKDLSYQCLSCHYLIHRRCAMLPSITNHDVHTHPLSLSFGLPSQYHNFNYICKICDEYLDTREKLWLYYCELCRYFVHIKCMAIKKPEIEVDLKGLVLDDMPCLPMSDKSMELIHRFLLKSNSLGNPQQEISTFSHRHPLIYSNDEHILEDGIDDGEEVLCDGCIEPIISPPYYHCAECRYFLHLPCAELPHELQHPSHRHPLILSSKSRFYDVFKCHDCEKRSNGVFFSCTYEGCNFYLDVKCAALPEVVEHKSHNHPLIQTKFIYYAKLKHCGVCGLWCGDILFGCEPCKFYLHRQCLMLPKTSRHRFDSKHPLTLRYPPHYYHPRPFDCAECEKEINPNYWLYHCEECDLSFHVYCINLSWEYNNSKFGQKLQIGSHPHPLKYVYKASVRSTCHGCLSKICYFFCLECETCNFHLCGSCVQKIEPYTCRDEDVINTINN